MHSEYLSLSLSLFVQKKIKISKYLFMLPALERIILLNWRPSLEEHKVQKVAVAVALVVAVG